MTTDTVQPQVTRDRLIYVRWSDDGQHIRKWAREPFEGATAFANAGNGAPLGPFDADDHYPLKDLPFALRSIAENIHIQCADHVLEDMVRIVTDAANEIEDRTASTPQGADVELLQLVASYADYQSSSDDRWEQGKAAAYRELGRLVSAALSRQGMDAAPDTEGVDDELRAAILGLNFANTPPIDWGDYESLSLAQALASTPAQGEAGHG